MKIVSKIIRKNLIVRCRADDKNAFNILMQPYERALRGYLLKLTGDEEITKDLLQEAFLKIWVGLKNYNESGKFRQWIFTIAHNVFVDYLKKFKSFEELEQEEYFASSAETPLELLIEKEKKERLEAAINKLPVKQKEVLVLRFSCGLKFREIAGVTSQPLNTVLGLMHSAKNNIKKNLEKENE